MWLAMLVAFAVRLFIGILSLTSGDLYNYAIIANLASHGQSVYTHAAGEYNYPPLWMWILTGLWRIHEVTSFPYHILVKTPIILADVAIVGLLYRIVAARSAWLAGVVAWIYALLPISILTTSIQAQFDSIPTLCCVLAVWLLTMEMSRGQPRLAALGALILGIGILLKMYPAVLLPLFVIGRRPLRWTVACLALAVLPVVLASSPYLLATPAAFTHRVLGYSGVVPWWGYYGIIELVSAVVHKGHWFTAMTTAALAFSKYIYLIVLGVLYACSRPRTDAALWVTAALALLLFYAVVANFGINYLVWASPFLLIVSSYLLTRLLLVVLALASLYSSVAHIYASVVESGLGHTHILVLKAVFAAMLLAGALTWGIILDVVRRGWRWTGPQLWS
jgi:hypothetical protein